MGICFNIMSFVHILIYFSWWVMRQHILWNSGFIFFTLYCSTLKTLQGNPLRPLVRPPFFTSSEVLFAFSQDEFKNNPKWVWLHFSVTYPNHSFAAFHLPILAALHSTSSQVVSIQILFSKVHDAYFISIRVLPIEFISHCLLNGIAMF